MLKFVGGVLIISAATLYGFLQAAHYVRRPKQIRLLISALGRMETEITYALTPLPEAFASLGKQVAEPLSSLFRLTSERLSANDGTSTREIWHRSVKEVWARTSMKQAEQEVVLQLGSVLGVTDRSDQIKHLRLAISQLQAEETESREEQRRYEKMWKSLGVLIGALIVILMY
ncbi:stage III sporulation protein SpoIIIAB [Paenibacillus aceris]|uniref:Stage III sporulation protein AB n=1 Tax=Paenibacillus aceris TaxID=869555 RepID=A0ABS4HU21_9BACL|nr:stage III sporulation protein SpoIIIAB [Paenibacillus aceris]MBP1962103.1 stage III sporulation protein AB [Paenibacillus aceris]NHW34048.1 stage III sporulation protein AB [Paenibacillus aceris]